MPDPKHLARLKKGVEAWNRWREKEPEVRPDLSEADLSGMDLCGINLHRANLKEAKLEDVYLAGADLSHAELSKARLWRANLVAANLTSADLSGADLSSAKLVNARLTHAVLIEASLDAHLEGADLSFAVVGKTFLEAFDLHLAKGLDQMIHSCQSNISGGVVRSCEGMLPQAFLENMHIFEWGGTVTPRGPEHFIAANVWLGNQRVQLTRADVNEMERAMGLKYPESFFKHLGVLGPLQGTVGFQRAFPKARVLFELDDVLAARKGIPPNLLPFMLEEQSTWSDIFALEVDEAGDDKRVVLWADHAVVMDWQSFPAFLRWARAQADKHEDAAE